MNKKVIALIGLSVVAGSAMAQTFTVATFDDPSRSSSRPLVKFTGGATTTGALSGEWGFAAGSTTGLTLRLTSQAASQMGIASTTFNDAKFTYDNGTANTGVQFTNGAMNAGQNGRVRFFDSAGNEIFRIRFTGGIYSPVTSGASFIFAHALDFQRPNGTSYGFSQQSFSFAFANQTSVGNDNTATASFTSSAVPEPMTLGLLALGAAGLAARRKRKS